MEQKINDPIKWLDVEIQFLKVSKELNHTSDCKVLSVEPQKDWLKFSEMLKRFGTSKMALIRRMAEGMPFIKFGNQLRFFPSLVDEWLVSRS